MGGLYVYKTRNVVAGWFNYVTNRRPSSKSPFYAQRLHAFNILQTPKPDKKAVVFAGDSLMQTFEWGEYFSDLKDTVIINRGINGDTVAGLTERTEEIFRAYPNPEKVFIMVGSNDEVSSKSV